MVKVLYIGLTICSRFGTVTSKEHKDTFIPKISVVCQSLVSVNCCWDYWKFMEVFTQVYTEVNASFPLRETPRGHLTSSKYTSYQFKQFL